MLLQIPLTAHCLLSLVIVQSLVNQPACQYERQLPWDETPKNQKKTQTIPLTAHCLLSLVIVQSLVNQPACQYERQLPWDETPKNQKKTQTLVELRFAMFFVLLSLVVLTFVKVEGGPDAPIVKLTGNCAPFQSGGEPTIHLTADVPAYAMAKCRNGDKQLTTSDDVNFVLPGLFDQSYTGARCLFYKKEGSNTYTVDVEVGWGEKDSQVVQQRKIHTISCAYDDHGRAISSTETISDWFLNPWESQHLLGGNASAIFALQVWDVLDKEITTDISIGRMIRLAAFDTTGNFPSFRALSCLARNALGRYFVLRAGCGDGLVFEKISGFRTESNCVYSPYFGAFKLQGDDNTVQFECVFTVCKDLCNGSSCPRVGGSSSPKRVQRSLQIDVNHPYIIARSEPITLGG